MQTTILLHNIRSSHNVGSLFRTADAAGVSRVYLSGYTPAPTDRFGRVNKEIAKTALGAETFVPWERVSSVARMIGRLKSEGWRTVGIEQDEHAIDYRTLSPHDKTLFVLGNEVRGISVALRKQCDTIVEIPMRGALIRDVDHPRHSGRGKESLNVSVAAGIVIFSATK